MSRVAMPQQSGGGTLGKVGTLVGGIMGAASGGPAGGLAGSQTGGSVGSMGDGLLGGNKGGQAGVNSAVQRRIDTMQPAQNPGADLAAAQNALSSMPEAYQKQYGPVLRRAQTLNSGGMA